MKEELDDAHACREFGQSLAELHQQVLDLGGLAWNRTADPGKADTVRLHLADYRTIAKPGVYTVDCSFRVIYKEGQSFLVNTSFRLTVIPRTEDNVRRVLGELVKQTLRERRQAIPCMAGVASAQIAPNGDVWTCCVRAQSMGNLRDHDYDFRSV